jgi:hypothetical protein
VTFLAFSNSGAAIPDLTTVWKTDWEGSPRPPQIELAKAALCKGNPNYWQFQPGSDCSEARRIDFVLLSIGGNDAHFGDAIRTCGSPIGLALPFLDRMMENCTAQSLPDPPEGGPDVVRFGEPGWVGNWFTMGVEDAIRNLNNDERLPNGSFRYKSSYPAVNEALRQLPFKADTRVLISEYPDVLTTKDGSLCSEIVIEDAKFDFIDGNINGSEILWAKTRVTGPLNEAVAATVAWGWEPLTGIDEEFLGRAACDYDGFSVTFQESQKSQGDENGSIHPNAAGQDVLGRHFAYAMGVRDPLYVTRPTFATTTDGRPPALCPTQQVVVGTSCRGSSCDDLDIMCKPNRPGTALANFTWGTRWVTDGDNGLFDTAVCTGTDPVRCEVDEGVSCNSGVVVGIECRGSFCDDVSLICRDITAGRLKNCGWTSYYSEETRWNVFSAGKVANGVRCTGSYCNLMSYYVCDLVP